jgi:hypothetical protein
VQMILWCNAASACHEGTRRNGKGMIVNGYQRLMAVALAVIAFAVALPAYGQYPGGANGGRQGAGGKGADTMRPVDRPGKDDPVPAASLSALVAYRLDVLDQDLRLSPEQHVAWKTYSDRVMQMADDMMRTMRTLASGDMTAPQRLDKLADVMRDRLTAMEDIADAGKRLYSVLTPGQQALADRRLAVVIMPLAGAEPAAADGARR